MASDQTSNPQASAAPAPQPSGASQPAPTPPASPAPPAPSASPLLVTPTQGRIVALGEGLGDPSPSDLKK